jgi:hypothetical protein
LEGGVGSEHSGDGSDTERQLPGNLLDRHARLPKSNDLSAIENPFRPPNPIAAFRAVVATGFPTGNYSFVDNVPLQFGYCVNDGGHRLANLDRTFILSNSTKVLLF